MPRVPHLHLPPPWQGDRVAVPPEAVRHLGRVLRLRPPAPVTYTDGAGTVGEGTWEGETVVRGPERTVAAPRPRVTVAAAPPRRSERQRYLVEKLAELGVARLVWLETRRGEGRPPRPERARAWAVAALRQSRGAHLMRVDGPTPVDVLEMPVWVADPAGEPMPPPPAEITIAVGPEGGFTAEEVRSGAQRIALGERILRVETAAVVAAALAILYPRVDVASRLG